VRQFSYDLFRACRMGRYEGKQKRNRERVFQTSHINSSVERRRESIRWMRFCFLIFNLAIHKSGLRLG